MQYCDGCSTLRGSCVSASWRGTPTPWCCSPIAPSRREKDTGLSVRGMLAIRCSRSQLGVDGSAGTRVVECSTTGEIHGHLVEWVSKTQRHVTRATFASELYGGTDAVDQGKIMQLNLHELYAGTSSLETLRTCLLYTSPSPRDRTRSRMPSSA